MQPLPYYKREIDVRDFSTLLQCCESNQYSLKSFSFLLGTISDSAQGFRYKKNSRSGTLTSVFERVSFGEKFYTERKCVEVKIENTQEFEKNVFDIFAKYGSEFPDDVSSALLRFKLRCYDNINEEEVEVIDMPYYPKWYQPLCDYLDSFYDEYVS